MEYLRELQHGPSQHGDGEGCGYSHLQRASLASSHVAASHVAKAQVGGSPLLQKGGSAPGDGEVGGQGAHALSIIELEAHADQAAIVVLRGRK